VFQRSKEFLKDYIERIRCEINNVENPSNESVLTAISVGLWKDGKLYESIYESPIRDLGKFYKRAAKKVSSPNSQPNQIPVKLLSRTKHLR